LYIQVDIPALEHSEKPDARPEEAIHKVEHDRTFKKHHTHHHHHHSKKESEEVDGNQTQTVRALSGVQTPQMFLINQGIVIEEREGEYDANDGDSDDFLNLDPLVPGDV
jgi:hypothetical protein